MLRFKVRTNFSNLLDSAWSHSSKDKSELQGKKRHQDIYRNVAIIAAWHGKFMFLMLKYLWVFGTYWTHRSMEEWLDKFLQDILMLFIFPQSSFESSCDYCESIRVFSKLMFICPGLNQWKSCLTSAVSLWFVHFSQRQKHLSKITQNREKVLSSWISRQRTSKLFQVQTRVWFNQRFKNTKPTPADVLLAEASFKPGVFNT